MANEVLIHIKAKDDASRHIDSLGDKFGGLGKAAAVGVGVGVAALGALGFGAVSAAADFQKAMSEVKAVSGATNEEFAALDALALQLGKDTVFSAKEAAEGIAELVKGGVDVQDVLNGAAGAMLNLASAGGVKLPEAAEIASNAMAMFGLRGEDMAHVADLIAGAANASSLSVGDFRYSLQMVGAVARTAGQSFDQTALAIAVLGKQGLKGSDAGTSLKTMLLNLIPTTKTATAEMQRLGLITADGANKFVDAEGKIKSMRDIAGELQRATEGLSDAERMMALQTIFGTDAVRAAAILAREGATGFDQMAAAMGKVSAESVAATKLDNLSGSVQQLSGSWETLLITLGKQGTGPIRAGVDWVTGIVNSATEAIEGKGFVGGLITSIKGHIEEGDWGAVGGIMGTLIGDGIGNLASTVDKWLTPKLPNWVNAVKGHIAKGEWKEAANIMGVASQDVAAGARVAFDKWQTEIWPIWKTNLALLIGEVGKYLKEEGPGAFKNIIGALSSVQGELDTAAEGAGKALGVALVKGLRLAITDVKGAIKAGLEGGFREAVSEINTTPWQWALKIAFPMITLPADFQRGIIQGIISGVQGGGSQPGAGGAPESNPSGATYWDPATQSYKPAQGYASGGIISEPIFGMGLRTGRGYSFGESGPEAVTPLAGSRGGGLSISGPLVSIGSIEVRDSADEDRLVDKIAAGLQTALAQSIGQYTRSPIGLARTV